MNAVLMKTLWHAKQDGSRHEVSKPANSNSAARETQQDFGVALRSSPAGWEHCKVRL